jgi:peptidyl-prolyl cis-trans isomerase D
MLELFRNRQSAMKYVLGILLTLIAVSMVVTMIPNLGTDFGQIGAPSEVVAKVGDETITVQDVQFAVSNALRGRELPPELVELYLPEIINKLITERAMYLQAREMGLSMTPNEQAEAVRSTLGQAGAAQILFDENGQLRDPKQYEQFVLQQLNMTVRGFEDGIMKQALIVKMQNLAADAIVVPPQELERDFHLRNDKVRIKYAALSREDLAMSVQVTQADIDEHWAGFKSTFKIPGKRNLEYVVLDRTRMATSIEVPESELRQMYQERIQTFTLPERRRSRHILFKTVNDEQQALPKEEIAKKKKKAEETLKQLRGGADFADLAKKLSEDTGSAVNGGDLDFRQRDGGFVKPFEDSVFTLKLNEISNLVETQFGFHIIQVTAMEPGRTRPFEEVKAELAVERNRAAVSERIQQQADQVRAALMKSSADGEAVAKQLGFTFQKVDNVMTGDPLPELGAAEELNAQLAGLQGGQVSPVVAVGSDKLVVARLAALIPERQANLNEVLDRVTDGAKNQKIEKTIQAKQTEMANKLRELKTVDAAAKAMGLAVKISDPVTRTDQVPGLGPLYQFGPLFDEAAGKSVGPVNLGATIAIAEATEKIPADMSRFSEQRADLLREAKGRRSRERGDLFAEGVLQRFQDKKRIQRNEDAIKRVTELLRGSRAS